MTAGPSARRDRIALAAFVVACFAVSGLGGAVTSTSVDGWYRTLAKPPFNPPDWLFAPVWTALFLMMAIAAWRVWRTPASRPRTLGLSLFAAQLAVNLLWSVLFFGAQAIGAALVDIVALLALVVATGVVFHRSDRLAGWLMAPYVAWVAFAGVLNAALWWLN